ncbi:MAG: HNH endonuclease [Thaumarchaeota archaeon]|nr:HNH endonuclease [Nitrososphaerota archaeon]
MSAPPPSPTSEREKIVQNITITPEHVFSYADRLRGNPRKRAIDYLLIRDGNFCFSCKAVLPNPYAYDVDHINGKRREHVASNLRLSCHSCNAKEDRKQTALLKQTAPSAIGERENLDATTLMHKNVDYSKGSPEMQANDFAEDDLRSWLTAHVKSKKRIPYSEAINSGAELFGISPTTSGRYIAKITSSEGPLMRYKDIQQKKLYITARPETLAKWKTEIEDANQELENRIEF